MGYDMGKVEVKRIGGSFSHAHCSTLWKHPNTLTYVDDSDIWFFIDAQIMDVKKFINEGRHFYGWLHESKSIIPHVYEYVKNNYKSLFYHYEYIFTHDIELLKLDDRFLFAPACGYWIEEIKRHTKSKLVSFITSNKRMCEGHNTRLQILAKYKDKVDLYGRGFNEIEKKEQGLVDYMFSFAIENGKYDTYYTEKVLDCFATGTVPIFRGSRNILTRFNGDGIIFYTDDFDISFLSYERYMSMMPAIIDNMEKVKDFYTVEDWLVKEYAKLFN